MLSKQPDNFIESQELLGRSSGVAGRNIFPDAKSISVGLPGADDPRHQDEVLDE